jgi:cytochrome c oxidase assembly factor CtaG
MTPLTASTALTSWQFAPLVSAMFAGLFGLYLVCVARVRRRHPARPWPLPRTLAFLTGLVITAIATQSSVGVYDDVLFSVHMVQHVLLIMVAPPFLVAGRPVTLLLHSWGNPVHSIVKRAVRSGTVTALTRPAVATILYCAVVVGTHTPPFMDLVLENEAVHDAEHALYLVAGCVFFLVVLGTEPLRHRVSALGAFLMLLVTMLADSGTGVVYTLQSREVFAPYARVARDWGPGLVTDLHAGGYIMFIGSDAVMSVIAIMLAARLLRPAGGPAGSPAGVGMLPGGPQRHADAESDAALGAYNEYLRKLTSGADA